MELHSFQFILKKYQMQTNKKCHHLPMDDDDDSHKTGDELTSLCHGPQQVTDKYSPKNS